MARTEISSVPNREVRNKGTDERTKMIPPFWPPASGIRLLISSLILCRGRRTPEKVPKTSPSLDKARMR